MIANSLRAPEVIESDFERFLVHDRFEILSILRRLQARNEPVTLNLDDGEFVLTILLAVNPDFEEMVFDCSSDPGANRKLMQAERLTLVANIGGIKVQFNVRRPDTTIFEGRPALRMRLPEIMLRLQRRDFYRIPASLACETALDSDDKVRVLELRVVDLSLGGIALVTDKTYVEFTVGQVLENCRISLGTLGTLALDLEVKNVSEAKNRNGLRQSRIGCEFANLQRVAETLISRYIGQKERERRSKT
jgi:c-di-GMP-binding flagellar brake protein YcgR